MKIAFYEQLIKMTDKSLIGIINKPFDQICLVFYNKLRGCTLSFENKLLKKILVFVPSNMGELLKP